MKIIDSIDRFKIERKRLGKKSIGFVPTMGYLHQGHLNLVKQSKKENEVTVVSIFVNPTQFAADEDYGHYPRDLDRDFSLLKNEDVDIVFTPDSADMYPPFFQTFVTVNKLSQVLCGNSRPIHFQGVTTVVLKLFNVVNPHRAYFGQKDAQQAVIIKKMVEDLNIDVAIRVKPIVREDDGLAMSSRNVYLSPSERQAALGLSKALEKAESLVASGSRDVSGIKTGIKDELSHNPIIKIDYIDIVHLHTLEPLQEIDPDNTLVAGAIWIGKTRLIDNFILGEI